MGLSQLSATIESLVWRPGSFWIAVRDGFDAQSPNDDELSTVKDMRRWWVDRVLHDVTVTLFTDQLRTVSAIEVSLKDCDADVLRGLPHTGEAALRIRCNGITLTKFSPPSQGVSGRYTLRVDGSHFVVSSFSGGDFSRGGSDGVIQSPLFLRIVNGNLVALLEPPGPKMSLSKQFELLNPDGLTLLGPFFSPIEQVTFADPRELQPPASGSPTLPIAITIEVR